MNQIKQPDNIWDDATMHMVLKLRGGKPVILYKDAASHNVQMKLTMLDNTLMDALYPVPEINGNQYTWNYAYDNKTNLLVGEKNKYPYLFYEFMGDYKLFVDEFKATMEFKGDYKSLSEYLEGIAYNEGMDERNVADFVTYWLPQMMQPSDEQCRIRFMILHEEYTRKILLETTPKPTYEHRFFMLWKKYDLSEELGDIQSGITVVNKKWNETFDSSYVLEWGGMNIQ